MHLKQVPPLLIIFGGSVLDHSPFALPPCLSTPSWSLAANPLIIHHPMSFWAPWTQSCPKHGPKPGNTLPLEAEIHWANTNLLAGPAGTKVPFKAWKNPAIYKAPSWLLGVQFPLARKGHCHLLEKIIPFTAPWPRVTECPILWAARKGDSMQGGLDVVTSPLMVKGSWGCQRHRWLLLHLGGDSHGLVGTDVLVLDINPSAMAPLLLFLWVCCFLILYTNLG